MANGVVERWTRRRAALGLSGLTAGILGAAGGQGAAAKKKKKKPKPPKAPEPLAFAIIRVTDAFYSSFGPTWQVFVEGGFFHPASEFGDDRFGFQPGINPESPPDEVRARVIQTAQSSVSSALGEQGRVVAPERIAVTLL